jgi:serine/threonine-protein kinase
MDAILGSRYPIDREVGRGGMATVYLARDAKHDRPVAVKIIHPALAVAIGGDRFLREIQLAARLQHPHLLGLIDSGETEEPVPRPFYVMPFFDGESLRDRLERDGQLSVADALRLVREIGGALHYAHGQGVIHRDVKPENVLLAHGQAILADFGIARALREAGGDRLTATGVSLGTPAYMSPEQAGGSDAVDARSDQYSLACLLYETLAGEPPFTARSGAQVMAKQVLDPVPPLATLRAGLPAAVVAAITRALAKAPVDRHRDLAEFLAALEAPEPAVANPSLVVLPFVNASPDPDTDYFADGLTEEVIADLSNIRALKVIARNSAMRLKGTDKDARTLGRELDVRYVLAGSVRRAGGQLRITAQLAEAAEDRQIWAGKFAGTVDDVFDLQERLAREIVQALALTLSPQEDRRLAVPTHASVAVFECYYRARHAYLKWTAEGLQEAVRMLEQGIATHGESELLLSQLGAQHCWLTAFGGSIAAHLAAAERCVATIYAQWPGSPHGDLLNGIIQYRRGNPRASVEALERARRGLPHDADPPFYLSCSLMLAGQSERARRAARAGISMDPLNQSSWLMEGMSFWWSGDPTNAEVSIRRAMELEPGATFTRGYLGLLYLATERPADAAPLFDSMAGSGDVAADLLRQVWLAHQGRADEVRRGFTPAVIEAASGDETSSYAAAAAYALIGDRDEALRWLAHMLRERGLIHWPYFAHHEPFLRSLRGDPRFEALLSEMKAKYEAFDVPGAT